MKGGGGGAAIYNTIIFAPLGVCEWILHLVLWEVELCTCQSKPWPLPPSTCGALVGLYLHMDSSLSPQYVGDSHVLSLWCGGMWGVSRGFVLIQDGDHHSCKDFWVYFATRDHWRWRTQMLTCICGIWFLFKSVHRLI